MVGRVLNLYTSWVLLGDTVPKREAEEHGLARESGDTAWSQVSQLRNGHVPTGGTEAAEASKGQTRNVAAHRAEDRIDRVL